MNDLDLEDIESRLYSQVYHGLSEETGESSFNLESTYLSEPTNNNMRKQGGRYFGPWTPAAKHQNKNVSTKPNSQSPTTCKDYSKDYGRPQRPDIPINQVIVVSPNKSIPVVCMTPRELRKAHWKAKLKEKRRQKRNLKWEKEPEILTESVITISDSEDDSCVLVEKKLPVLLVGDSDNEEKLALEKSKDEEAKQSDAKVKNEKSEVLNKSLSDDVIFVEPVPLEVINLDEESIVQDQNAQNVETASSASSDNISVGTSPSRVKIQRLHKERKELLTTPDSASNDFMNNSGVELTQTNFNFSLHGSDFNNREFLKPAAPNETCETESSSSTTDVNSVNLMKTAVFNEVDFPGEMFSENNLESFENFITPIRNKSVVTDVQSSPVRPDAQKQNVFSSDSDSESDFDEPQVKPKEVSLRNKSLPELSPMQINVPHVPKKCKKSSLGSKFDLLSPSTSSTPIKDLKQKYSKKKKKNKKKKSSETAVDNNEDNSDKVVTNSEKNVTGGEASVSEKLDEPKQKKRRSSQLESSTVSESPSRKKLKENVSQDVELTESITDALVLKNTESKEAISKKTETAQKIISDKESEVGECEETPRKVPPKEESMLQRNSILNKSIEKNKDNSVMEKIEILEEEIAIGDRSLESVENSVLKGLVVLDETICDEESIILSSDNESVLSALHGDQDIQLNCEQSRVKTVTSPVTKDLPNFSVSQIHKSMSNDPNLWMILECDRTPQYYSRSKGRRCNKCREFGHTGIRCPNKVESKCTLCGESGHYEPRCPNKICRQCGQRSPYSTTYCTKCFKYRYHICSVCSMVGHYSDTCPDLWRRYHLTTTDGPLTSYDGPPLKQRNQLWCSGCAQSGHLDHSCGFYKSIYPASNPFISSYQDVYKAETGDNEPQQQGAAPNYGMENDVNSPLLIQPLDQRTFGFNQNQNQSQHYGQMNQQLMNPWVDGIFVANQQNFFNSPAVNPGDIFQYGQTNNQLLFENPLPNYISFEPPQPPENYNQGPDINFTDQQSNVQTSCSKSMRRKNHVFFSASTFQLQHFIKMELQRLGKLSIRTGKLVKELRKRQVPKRNNNEKEEYYETLNMLLFGVFNLFEGKTHLDKLKQLRRVKRVDNTTRRQLHRSYCYIFGHDKHYGVDYNHLLSRC